MTVREYLATDRPRSCGTYRHAKRVWMWWIGSSPLLRGLRGANIYQWSVVWTIPAPSGLTPPLLRGLLVQVDLVPIGHRTIPGCAGHTPSSWSETSQRTDHPRLGGAYKTCLRRLTFSGGSSPRGQGLPVEHVLDRAPNRTIPASAGPTGKGRGMDVRERGCPRTPGAYASWSWQTYRKRGSSPVLRGLRGANIYQWSVVWTIPAPSGLTPPLLRGLLVQVDLVPIGHRTIPGCAGHTPSSWSETSQRTDHPRLGGAYKTCLRRLTFSGGSSPRGQGLPVEHVLDRAPNRTIPASAGPTGKGRGMDVRERGCPRTPGAYASWSWQTYRKRGSSPVLRGLQKAGDTDGATWRTIPAWAGRLGCGPPRVRRVGRLQWQQTAGWSRFIGV